MSAQTVQFFFIMRNQIKLYHWQTYSYSRHKATDDVVKSLDEHIDQFVEVYMGKYGRPKMSPKTGSIDVRNLSEKQAVAFVKNCINELLTTVVANLSDEKDSDLFNIRDEMLADLNQLLYLFTLK
jgi:DNA-binding ferritin-like protein